MNGRYLKLNLSENTDSTVGGKLTYTGGLIVYRRLRLLSMKLGACRSASQIYTITI